MYLFFSTQWINSRTLVLVDSHEKLQVVDRPSQEVLETLDLEQVQLVYNSRHFKSLATGGNVSQALVRKWQWVVKPYLTFRALEAKFSF